MIDDDPSDLVHDLAARCVFGEHELGRPIIGSAATVRALANADIAAYHRARYGAGNVVVAAAGNVEHATLCALVAERLAAGRGHAGRALAAAARRGGARSCSWRGTPSSTTSACRRPAWRATTIAASPLALLDHVLGGAASSRLVQEIREKRGMAYSVYSYTSSYDDTGQVGIYVGTRAENVAECVEIARAQIAELGGGRARRATSWSVRRRASRAACCSRSSRRRRACRGSAAACSEAARSCRWTRWPRASTP